MNVYVETNFVLEVALLQEQHASCLEIISLSEDGRIQLIVPAYCLVEPFETLIRHQKRRHGMKQAFDRELSQIARTATYVERLDEFRGVTDILVNVAQDEATNLDQTISLTGSGGMRSALEFSANSTGINGPPSHQRRGIDKSGGSQIRELQPVHAMMVNRRSSFYVVHWESKCTQVLAGIVGSERFPSRW